MNGDLGGVVIKPDQMQIVNPLLILILVPIFETVIYPCFKKSGLLTPLRRIGCGLVLCGLSFVVSGFVEIALEVITFLFRLAPININDYLFFINFSPRMQLYRVTVACNSTSSTPCLAMSA
jgi:dipeptide/tripeptide permease